MERRSFLETLGASFCSLSGLSLFQPNRPAPPISPIKFEDILIYKFRINESYSWRVKVHGDLKWNYMGGGTPSLFINLEGKDSYRFIHQKNLYFTEKTWKKSYDGFIGGDGTANTGCMHVQVVSNKSEIINLPINDKYSWEICTHGYVYDTIVNQREKLLIKDIEGQENEFTHIKNTIEFKETDTYDRWRTRCLYPGQHNIYAPILMRIIPNETT